MQEAVNHATENSDQVFLEKKWCIMHHNPLTARQIWEERERNARERNAGGQTYQKQLLKLARRIGVFYAHYNAWRKIRDEEMKHVLMVEDDVTVAAWCVCSYWAVRRDHFALSSVLP